MGASMPCCWCERSIGLRPVRREEEGEGEGREKEEEEEEEGSSRIFHATAAVGRGTPTA
jgi:hypothetical protein